MDDNAQLVDNEEHPGQDIEASNNISNGATRRFDGDDSPSTTNTQNQPTVTPERYTSQLAAFLLLLNVTVGAGLLAMPYTMQSAGLVTSLFTMALFVTAVVVTCIMCTELTVKTNVESFHKIVQARCHPYLYQFTQLAILTLVFGTVVAYIVVIGDQADRVFASLYGHTFCYSWYMNRRFIMTFVTFLIVKPLCCAKTVDFLKYASFAGLLSIGFVTYVVISEFIKSGHIAEKVNYFPENWSNIGSILPVFCIAFHCHLSLVPTVAEMKKQEKYTSYYTISAAMISAGIIYGTVCIFAVLTFGDKIQSDLTESFSSKTWPVLGTIGIIAFKCVVTLPLAFLPARLSLIDILSKISPKFDNLNEPIKRISVVIITLNLALLLALYVPDILIAVDILGCLAVVFVFTLPALCYLHSIKENRLIKQQLEGIEEPDVLIYNTKDKLKIGLSYFFIIFGLIMTVVVLYKSIEKITSSSSSEPLCYK